ncbi:MAG: DUF1552 domain-containing protein [Gemmataceae bacterium]
MLRDPLNRRTFLRGVTLGSGTVLLAPFLDRLEAQANDPAAAQQRFVFVTVSNGINAGWVQPATIESNRRNNGQLHEVALADHRLPAMLEPLEPFKNRVTILQGLSGKVAGGGHSTGYGALGCYPSSRRGVMAETIDLALSRARPATFSFFGQELHSKHEVTINYGRSAAGPNQPVALQCRPDLAYNQLFGSVAAGAGRQAFEARSNLLDFMVDDIRRVEGALGGEERRQLQSYLQAFENMTERRSRLNDNAESLRRHAPTVTNRYTSAETTDRLDAQFDLATAALVSGLTNVVTLSTDFNQTYRGLGITLGTHPIGHGRGENGKTSAELMQTIRRFYAELIARMARRLQDVREGDGTMLDNTLIVFLSDAAEAHHSTCVNWPIVLLGGRLGGRLRAGGRYLDFPSYGQNGHRTVANLYTALLQTVGVRRARFGFPDLNLRDINQDGPLTEILA